MRVLVYLRVSSLDQLRSSGNPISAQRSACLEYAKRHDYTVIEETDIYIDGGISGRTDNRKSFQAMMERIKTDESVGGIVAYDISRIFRNAAEYLKFTDTLKRGGKKFFSIMEPFSDDNSPSGWFSGAMMALYAELRSRQDGAKIREGMLHKGREGCYPGKAPYGYKNMREILPDNKQRAWIEPHPDEARWIKEVFSKFATGHYSLHSLTQELREEGFPTRNGKPLKVSTLEEILKKKIYIGIIEWSDLSDVRGTHEPLVDEAIFYKVQSIMEGRVYGGSRKRKHSFLLRDLAYCGECGSRVIGAYHKGRKKHYAYYSCLKRKGAERVSCSQSAWLVTETEAEFKKLMKSIRIPTKTAERIRNRVRKEVEKLGSEHKDKKVGLTKQLSDIEARKKTLNDKYFGGKIDDQTYQNYKAELDQEETKAKTDLFAIEEVCTSVVEATEKALEMASDCYRAYKKGTYEEKSMLAKAFFDKLIIKDSKFVEVKLKEPFQRVCGRAL